MINIKELLSKGETFYMEAKKATGGLPDSLWESYSAFANTDGGVILLGITDENNKMTVSGITDTPNKIKLLWDILNNRQKINVNILVERNIYCQEVDEKEIIVIEVPRADRRDKPIFINNDLTNGSFRRNASGDYHCTLSEIKSMLRDQSDMAIDSRVIEELTMSDLDKETIAGYRNHFTSLKPKHVWNRLFNDNFLHKIGAAGRSETGNLKPTLAGLVMFGTDDLITQILPDYFLDYREVSTVRRWNDRIVSNLGEWSGNIFDFFFKVTKRLDADIKVPFQMRNAIERLDETPVHLALREALTNAIIHADYYGRQGIVIEKRPEKVIFANPGIFRPNKEEIFDGGVSDPRNPNIFKMFSLIGIGERAGSGLFNIRTIWQDLGWQQPVWEEKFTPERLILSVPVENITEQNIEQFEYMIQQNTEKSVINIENVPGKDMIVSDNVPNNAMIVSNNVPDNAMTVPDNVPENRLENIFNLIRFDDSISTSALAQKLRVNKKTIKRDILKLKTKGLLERVGPNKGGYWKINDDKLALVHFTRK